MEHPLYQYDLVHVISQYVHTENLIALRGASRLHSHFLTKKDIEKHSAATKIQSYYKKHLVQKNLPWIFLNKLIASPTFRLKYLYIHDPDVDESDWVLDNCQTYPHICLRTFDLDTIPPLFKKIFGDLLDFAKWFDENVSASLKYKIKYSIINLPNKAAREKFLEEKEISL